MQQTASQ